MAQPAAADASGVPPVILLDVTDRVGTITLNRPERRNALNAELIAALDDAVRHMAENAEVKVVVLTGAPAEGAHGGFCSGGDIKGGGRAGPGGDKGVPPNALTGDLSRHDDHAAMSLHLMPKPTIAMVGGPAIGAGCSLAAACDLRFASNDAVFATNFSPNGLSGDYGGSFFWTRIGGTALARRLYLLNEKIPAPRALDLGMVHAVLPPGELRSYTQEIARTLVRTPASLLARMKENLNEAEDEVARRRWLFANEAEHQVRSGHETQDRLGRAQSRARSTDDGGSRATGPNETA